VQGERRQTNVMVMMLLLLQAVVRGGCTVDAVFAFVAVDTGRAAAATSTHRRRGSGSGVGGAAKESARRHQTSADHFADILVFFVVVFKDWAALVTRIAVQA